MWTLIPQMGMATATLDFTTAFSLVAAGLTGLLVLSGGMIAALAIQHDREQVELRETTVASPAVEHQKAA